MTRGMDVDHERDLLIEEAYRVGFEGRELPLHLGAFRRFFVEGSVAAKHERGTTETDVGDSCTCGECTKPRLKESENGYGGWQ